MSSEESDSLISKGEKLVVETEKKAEKLLTILWNDLPEWRRDNHYIHTGYRAESNSYLGSAASLGYLHNESVNIWTHLIAAVGAAVTGVIMYVAIRPRFAMATPEDAMVFACYFLGATVCLGMSATYHTIANHSEGVAKFGNRLDYLGIIFLIWGSFIPSIYYGFIREPALFKTYWTMITTIAAGTLIVVFHPAFRSSEWRAFRAFMFVMMGLSAVFPVVHGTYRYGWQQLELQMGVSLVVTQGALYILGAVIYAWRIPERWRPGSFDIWGSSHQIFHVLVVLAAAVHLVGLVKAYDYEHNYRTGVMSGYDTIGKLTAS